MSVHACRSWDHRLVEAPEIVRVLDCSKRACPDRTAFLGSYACKAGVRELNLCVRHAARFAAQHGLGRRR